VIPLTLGEVAALTAGRLSGGAAADATVTGEVVFDSRAAGAGGLFVALPGEHVDGHDFAEAAAEAGAVAVLAERDLDVPCVVVEDGARALARLARGVLDRLPEVQPGRHGAGHRRRAGRAAVVR
jgi:UDP-N-acetylmuramoyl-tripeptide--D-alanyl-D-alanine ligase